MSNQDQQPPWGKKKPQKPEDLLAQLIDWLQDFFSNEKQSGSINTPPSENSPQSPFAAVSRMLSVALVFVVLYGVYASFYKIEPGKVGVVLRLGEYYSTTQPGLHFKIPYVDQLTKVDVERVRKEEFGFGARGGSDYSARDDDPSVEALMMTADKNVISVAWIVQYRVGDPWAWLFVVQNPRQAIHDMSESVTRRIVGNMDFDYVLSNRELLAAKVKKELQEMLGGLFPKGRSGINIGTVQFKDINPPEPVKPAFNEVNEADQDMKRLVNTAQEVYNREIPKARGNAKKIVEEAYGYKAQRVNEATGESQRFRDILQAYQVAPTVTRRRMYLESMEQVMPGVKHVYIIDKNQQQSPIPLLNLGQPVLPESTKEKP